MPKRKPAAQRLAKPQKSQELPAPIIPSLNQNHIPCNDCAYFDAGKSYCVFMSKPTTATTICFAYLYAIIPACTVTECKGCQYLNKGCAGNRSKPLTNLDLHPHSGQYKVLESKKNTIAFIAGAQSGKSAIGPIWMHRELLKHSGGDGLVGSPTFPLLDKKLLPEYIDYFCNTLKIGEHKIAKRLIEVNGGGLECTIFFGSAEKPESLESATAIAVQADEAGQDKFKLSAWEAIQRRVSRSNARVLITTTPYSFGWLYQTIYKQWLAGDPDIDVIQFDSKDCPGFSLTKYESQRKKLPLWKFNMFHRGMFTRPAGMIYSDFDDKVNLVKPFPIPQKWSWVVGIDPGAVHTAIVWGAEEPGTKKLYIVRSYLDGNMTTKDHVKKASRFSEFDKVKMWIGGAKNEEQFRMDWRSEGITVQAPKVTDVEVGINKVIELIKAPSLFVFDSYETRTLLDEIGSYSRVLDDNNEPTEDIHNKKEYHCLDAVRYLCTGTSPMCNSDRLLHISARRFRKRWRSSP